MRGSLRGHDHHLAALHEHARQQRASVAQSAAEVATEADLRRDAASGLDADSEPEDAPRSPSVQLAN